MTSKTLKRSGWIALIAVSAGVLLFAIVYYLLPRLMSDPMAELERQTPVRIWTDEQGRILHVRRTYDAQWRFDVELDQISPEVIRTILATEDRNFYQHHGVDFAAVFRACGQNLTHGRIVSGASTITMQLAGMTETGPRRSLFRKFRQFLKARRLEQLYSKDRILKEYLNRLPFGGKIYGIEAAAQYYFGQHAAALNRSEAALLCGLPQRPNAYRPDRFPKEALKRRDRVLKQLEHLGVLAPGEGESIRRNEPLRFREYAIPAEFQRLSQSPDRMYFDLAAREAGPDCFVICCAYHPEAARILRNQLILQCRNLTGVRDAAGVLLENRTGRVLALTGTIHPDDPRDGQVNAATARRSAGSALKPFLYAEAISGGMIVPDTILMDLPVRYGDYSPGNYDGLFRGEVRARTALADSLNTPAIRLLEQLGVERVVERFRTLHLLKEDHRRFDGLSLALGTAGHTLLDLTAAYRVFPAGSWRKPTFLLGPETAGQEKIIFAEGTGDMIAEMLTRPMPGTSGETLFAWKTGTSNGNQDAWCFVFSPDFTLGVWFGNKDGSRAASLVGVEAAAPAAGRIMEGVKRFGEQRVRPDFPDSYRFDRLCSSSGLRVGPYCRESYQGCSLRKAPLRPCRRCEPGRTAPIRILRPLPTDYLAADGKITLLLAAAPGKCTPSWFLNGKYLGCFQEKKQTLPPGTYRLKAVSDSSEELPSEVRFRVLEQP
ncbi:MAG: transglycosylase domain-containing protein [Lentisphaeria bacterium]|nr:transglycosylase domain-containing protein [Lentisphaeria bacterium]